MDEPSNAAAESGPSGFPQSPSEFDRDPRISFSKLDNKWILETDEGTEYEYDHGLKRWVPVLDQALLEEQSRAYKVEGVDESAPTGALKKRKKEYVNGEEEQQPTVKPKKARTNTAVYITSLPRENTTISELHHVFSKCGVIAEEIDSHQPRIKMYEDDLGNFKGEALVVFFRPESVQLAVQMLDDTSLRLGDPENMKVQVADFSYKSQREVPMTGPSGQPGAVKTVNKGERKRVIQKTQKLNNKLADWSDDDEISTLHETSSRMDRVVILKHMFTLKELEEDPSTLVEIEQDIRDECAKLGPVINIVVFDREPEGVVSVRFGNSEAAAACVRLMNKRWFDERQLIAYISTGKDKDGKFRKSATTTTNTKRNFTDDGDGDGDDEEAKRLDRFGQWLEEGDETDKDKEMGTKKEEVKDGTSVEAME